VPALCSAHRLRRGGPWLAGFAGSAKLKQLHVQALDLLEEVHTAHDIQLKLPGSLRLIEKGNPNRLLEAKQHVAMAKLYDRPEHPTELLTAEQAAARHPLLDIDTVECAVWTPHDGSVDPTMLTNAVAAEARAAGGSIRLHAEAASVKRDPYGRFVVTLASGETLPAADFVVNAAGLWSRKVTAMAAELTDAAMDHEAYTIEHQYVVTEPVGALLDSTDVLPVVRDLAGSSYIRQEQKGLLVGPYEKEYVIHQDWPLGPPDTWGMELFPDDLARISPNLLAAIDVIPALGTVGFRAIVNGPTIWTGDSLPRVGRTRLPGWFDFNSLSYGITHALPLAEYLGHIMLSGDGSAPWDASDYFDPLRHGSKHSRRFTAAKIAETYTHNNEVVFPREHRPGGLDRVPLAPVIAALTEYGAQLGSIGGGGVAAPLLYRRGATSSNELRGCRRFHHFGWDEEVQAEADAVLGGVAVGYSTFSKIEIVGADARALVLGATSGVLPAAPMACRLSYALTDTGRVHSEYTVCRRTDTSFYVVGSRDHAAHDAEWFRARARGLGLRGVQVVDRSDDVEVLHVAGPDSATLLQALDHRVADIPFFHAAECDDFAGLGVAATVVRMSFTGCAGYELHVAAADAPAVLGALAGSPSDCRTALFGSLALDSLRIEKGYMIRADFDYAHYSECGIAHLFSRKRDFAGRHAPTTGITNRDMASVLLAVDTTPGWEWSVVGDSPIVHGETGAVVGYTTTAARGARTRKTIARAFVHTAAVTEECVLEACGHRWSVTPFAPL